MKRVLFVDDEQQILDGLQNLLRKQRHEWQMVFALGSTAGLAELARAPFDVVVADMRMPVLDGAAFLEQVRDRYPGTARVVLSGHAERELLMRALPVAHQFLSKPCDADLLRSVVERTCAVQQCLGNEAIRRIVGRLDRLPSVPEIYRKLTVVLNQPRSGIPEVAEVVEQDPAMCLKLLQLVNSAFFGLPSRMGSVKQAVTYLGTELIRGLVLTAHIFSGEGAPPIKGLSYRGLQEAALLTARLARTFLGKQERAGDAFTAALLHDIGKVILVQGLPEQYERVLVLARESRLPVHVVEREQLGVTHAEIGAHLLGIWGLPFDTMEVVCHHHAPGRVTTGRLDLLAAVHAADALADTTCSPAGRAMEETIDMGFIERSGFAACLPTWRELARESAQAAA